MFCAVFFLGVELWLVCNCAIAADLRLHGDDVYFTLENSAHDGFQPREGGGSSITASSKV